MADDDLLFKALRRAHDAGDTSAATRIAGMIKAGRAQAAPDDKPDVINNDQVDKPAEPERSTAEELGRQAYAGISGVGQGFFGLGDIAGAAGQMIGGGLRGEYVPPREAYKRARSLREGVQKDYPVTSTIGELAGDVATGGSIARATPSLALRAGQAGRNVLKLAGSGAAAAGTTAALKGEDLPTATAEGAVAGPLAAGAGKLAVKGARALRGLTDSGSSANAIQYLSDKLGETPQALRAAMDNFRRVTGAPPTLAEITNAGSAAELGKVAEARASAGSVMREANARVLAQRPARMQTQVESRGPTDDLANLVSVRDNAMNGAMGHIENVVVRVPHTELEDFADPDALRPLNRDLRSRILQATEHQQPAALTVRDIDNMRQAYADAGDTGQKHMYFDLSRRISQIGSRRVPSYGSALNEYQAFSRGIKGFTHGQQGKLPTDLKDHLDIADSGTPEYAAGRNIGVRTRVGREAGTSERGALNSANDLRQEAGTAQELRGALGPREAGQLQAQGQAETTGAERLAQATPGAKAPSDELANSLRTGLETIAAAGGHTLTGFKTSLAARLVTAVNVSSRTARKIAESATDPARLPGVIDALRRARLRDDQIRAILLPQISAGGGAVVEDVGQ